ncbi:MAG TPA: diacylglycerol kinase family lipid kinase [Clostridia bacterium]|nr:diacylglycerol kinase family lipid kinase [Clostridia bacterium]
MKTAFIINPAAGRGRTEKLWKKLSASLPGSLKKGDAYFTAGPGEAQTLARNLSRNAYRQVLVFGGDGTVNEALNGLELNGTALGIVPTGTGNDLCRTLGIAKDPGKALGQLAQGKTKLVDMGLVNGRRFLNSVGTGFDAEVVRVTNEQFRRLRGMPAYLASLVKVLLVYRSGVITVETESASFTGKMLLAAVGNGRFIGGGLEMFPRAAMDDGVFQVVLVGDVPKTQFVMSFPRIFSGTHLSHHRVSSFAARRVVIKSGAPLTVQVDGEIVFHPPLEVELVPKAIPVLVP